MATRNFSALTSGQSIAFDPNADVLFFDQTAISAGNLGVVAEGADSRVTVLSGTDAGKNVLLLNTSPLQLATSNVSFANASALLFGDNTSGTANDNAANTLTGTAGNDLIDGFGGNDSIQGNNGNDVIAGGAGNDAIGGNNGNDTIDGGLGNDTFTGGSGQDLFAFSSAGAANADTVGDFASTWDAIRLDAAAFSAIGAAGRFTSGDVRFFAGAGANSGHDADDRIVYNTTTGQLFYDADGNGAGASQLIATFTGAPAMVAQDISVLGVATPPPPPPSGQTINGTAGNDSLAGGPGNDTINGFGGNDTLDGAAGNDVLSGGDGNDNIQGGAGNDTLTGDWNNDSLDGGADLDTLLLAGARSNVTVDLAAGTMTGGDLAGTASASIANIENVDAGGMFRAIGITGSNGDNVLRGGNQADTISGGAGNDTLFSSASDSSSQSDRLFGGAGNDLIVTFSGGDHLLDGGPGNDTLSGGTGGDTFAFSAPVTAANVDTVIGFQSFDAIRLDAAVMPALGPSGLFSSNDIRFYAAPGAVSGHDGDDRVIYDSASGNLYYDADGNGSAAAQLIATLQPVSGSVPSLTASQISVVNGTTGAGFVITGTPGNDSLTGSDSNDTISGLGGDDTLDGASGNDRLDGGTGNDSLFGSEGADSFVGGDGNDTLDGSNSRTFDSDLDVETLDGGLGNDTYMVDNASDVLSDAGGTDTVIVHDVSWTLGAGFENLTIRNDNDSPLRGTGNALDNVISANWFSILEGGAGNDTILGSPQNDTLNGGDGNDSIASGEDVDIVNGGAGDDTLDGGFLGDDDLTGGTGADHFVLAGPGQFADRISDFASGADTLRLDGGRFANVGPSGNFSAGDERFFSGAGVTTAHDATDRVIFDTSTGNVYYDADGNGSGAVAEVVARLQPGASLTATDLEVINGTGGGQVINGTAGNDSLVGGPGDDTINGFAGNDTIDGGAGGADSMVGGPGDDLYFVDHSDDQVVELENAGIDEVRSSLASYTLSDWVNNLALAGGAVDGFGNAIENVITGNALDNILYGEGGNDSLFGGDGSDLLVGDTFDEFPGDDSLVGGAGNDTLFGGAGTDRLLGGDGNDFIDGEGGTDYLDGGAGDDYFQISNDRHPTLGGSYSGAGVETLDGGVGTDTAAIFADSNVTVDLLSGTLAGGAADGSGRAVLLNIENVRAGAFNDLITGNALANMLEGGDGLDTLNGGAGNDTLNGGAGADSFVFNQAPGTANADQIADFASGTDKIRLDGSVMTQIGASGNFAAGDARFFAGAGASAGHDADDRVVYNTTTNQLFYDADGNGAGGAQLIATLQSGAALGATDIAVDNGTATPPPTPGMVINGTAGNDSLVGGAGNDSMQGGAGADTMLGGAGNDAIGGNDGNDRIEGGTGNDTLSGGSGQDTLVFHEFGAANADVVTSFDSSWDRLQLDHNAMAALGATGSFSAGDVRFFAGAGAAGGHDADDRVVFNTSTGQLYYDDDGSGAHAAQLLAMFQTGAVVAATDISVI